jgi:hypothetical protein
MRRELRRVVNSRDDTAEGAPVPRGLETSDAIGQVNQGATGREGTAQADSNTPALSASGNTSSANPMNHLAPRLRVVHGRIVTDEDANRIDRHSDAQAQDGETATVEDELSHRINAGSYMKRERTARWTGKCQVFWENVARHG